MALVKNHELAFVWIDHQVVIIEVISERCKGSIEFVLQGTDIIRVNQKCSIISLKMKFTMRNVVRYVVHKNDKGASGPNMLP